MASKQDFTYSIAQTKLTDVHYTAILKNNQKEMLLPSNTYFYPNKQSQFEWGRDRNNSKLN